SSLTLWPIINSLNEYVTSEFIKAVLKNLHSYCKRVPRYRARHWIVERTHSWMNRFRRLLIRWEKKVENYVAMLHFACTCITCRAAGLFG
ncbi:MAG: hypothetical protein WBZ36_13550, partial [Candidatus Nitrosopolaris sp.]